MTKEQFKQRAIELEAAAEELAKDAFLKERSGYRFNKDEASLKPPYEQGTAIDYIEAEAKKTYSSYEGSYVFTKAVEAYLRISKEGGDGTD